MNTYLIALVSSLILLIPSAHANQQSRNELNQALNSLYQAEAAIFQAKQAIQNALNSSAGGVACEYVTRNSPHYVYNGSAPNENEARRVLRSDCVEKRGVNADDIICRDIAQAAKDPSCPMFRPSSGPAGMLCCYNE